MTTRPVVLSIPGMESARVVRDLEYPRTGGGAGLFDLYLPASADGLPPVVVFISGTDDARSWAGFEGMGRLAAAHGLAGVQFAKRYQRGQMLDGADDLATLVAHLRERADELGIDAERTCLWAFSGGGYILPVGMRGETPSVRCLINFYGGSDIRAILPMFPEELRGPTGERLSAIDLIAARPDAIPPILLVRAGRDRPQLNAEIDAFVQAALAANLSLEAINYPAGQHAFDILDDTPESRRIIRRAFAFAQERLGLADR
jgi:acetyl esterase/lipase